MTAYDRQGVTIHLLFGSKKSSTAVHVAAVTPQLVAPSDVLVRKRFVFDDANCAMLIWKSTFSGYLRPMSARSRLQTPQHQDFLGLSPFDSEKWKQGTETLFSAKVACAPAVERATVVAMWLFSVIVAAKAIAQHVQSIRFNHADLDCCIIGWCLSALAPICFRSFDANISFAVNDARKIGQDEIIHNYTSFYTGD